MNNLRNLALWIIIALLLVFLFNMFQGSTSHPSMPPLTFSEFNQHVVQGDVKEVTVQGDQIKGKLANGQAFATYAPANDPGLYPRMEEHNVNISVQPSDDGMPSLIGIALNWFPMLLLIGVWILFCMRGGPYTKYQKECYDLARRQAEALERIAALLEKKS